MRVTREEREKEAEPTYIGKYLVRGTKPKSFAVVPKEEQTVDEFHNTGRFLLLQFYKYYRSREPLCIKRVTAGGLAGTDFWVIFFSANYYATIKKGTELNGDHAVNLFYRSSGEDRHKPATCIGSSVFSNHFTKPGRDGLTEFICREIKFRKFVQLHATKTKIIPL